jgi:hypothetical protein
MDSYFAILFTIGILAHVQGHGSQNTRRSSQPIRLILAITWRFSSALTVAKNVTILGKRFYSSQNNVFTVTQVIPVSGLGEER